MFDDDNIFSNDADIEMANLQDTADREDRLAEQGICCHGWCKDVGGNKVECRYCGKVFNSFEDMVQERDERLI